MVFGMKSKVGATKATKPSKKAAAAATNGSPSNTGTANNTPSRKKGLKKTSPVAASSSATLGASTGGSAGSRQTKKTLGVRSTTSSKLKTTTVPLKRSNGSMSSARSGTSSKASSRASIASSTALDKEEREGMETSTSEAPTGNRRDMSVVKALEQELAAVSEGTGEANNGTNTAARNVVEEDTAPYGGLEDKYALVDAAVEVTPLGLDALEQAEADKEGESYDEEKVIDDGSNTHDAAAALEPTKAAADGNITPDAAADRQPRDEKHHRSSRSPVPRTKSTRRGSNERERHQERKEKKRPSKPRERAPRDHHHRAKSPPSTRPKSRSRSRNRPRKNDADRVDEYLKSRDADSYDEDDTYNPNSPSKSRFKKKMDEGVEEVHGTTQDILLSVFQVCCAFALRGKEINGFVQEIDNARAELR